jgi:hypothetical protein
MHVVWPDGQLVHRDDWIVLINPTGTEIGAPGEVVRLGAGNG